MKNNVILCLLALGALGAMAVLNGCSNEDPMPPKSVTDALQRPRTMPAVGAQPGAPGNPTESTPSAPKPAGG